MSQEYETMQDDGRRNDRLTRLAKASAEISRALLRVNSREELMARVCDVMAKEGEFLLAWIGWLNPQTRIVVPAGIAGDAADYLKSIKITADFGEMGQGPTGLAIREGTRFICNDFLTDSRTKPWHDAASKAGIRSSAAFPLTGEGGKIRGTLNLYSSRIDTFQGEDLAALEEIVSAVSYKLVRIEEEASREKAGEELGERERMLRGFVDASNAVFWIMKTHPELVLYVNPAFERIWGLSPSELYRQPRLWMDSIYIDDRPKIMEAFSNWVEKVPGSGYDVEYRIIRTDGETRWIHDRGFALYEEKDGNSRLAGIAEDITERKTAQEELLVSRERYMTILDNMMEGCMLIGRDWTYLYVNDAAARHGYQEKENLIGQTMMSVYPGVERSNIFAKYRECMEDRTPITFKSSYTFEDGTTNWYEFRVEPAREGIYVFSLNITDRLKADRIAGQGE